MEAPSSFVAEGAAAAARAPCDHDEWARTAFWKVSADSRSPVLVQMAHG